jgi:hypothetical protein
MFNFPVAMLAVPTAHICRALPHGSLSAVVRRMFTKTSSIGSPSRRCLAIARQRNPMVVVGLDIQVQLKLNTAVGANSQVVDAVRTS